MKSVNFYSWYWKISYLKCDVAGAFICSPEYSITLKYWPWSLFVYFPYYIMCWTIMYKKSYLKCKFYAIFWNIWVSINFWVIFIEKGPDLKFKYFHEKYRYALYFFCFIFFLYMAFGCSKGILLEEHFENSNFPICEWQCH